MGLEGEVVLYFSRDELSFHVFFTSWDVRIVSSHSPLFSLEPPPPLSTLLISRITIMINLIYALIGAAVGISIHHGLFIHGEWHVRAPEVVLYHLVYFVSLWMIITKAHWIIAGYLLALFTSITIYRVFFHRLKHFPGPIWARITKIWHAWKARHRQNHLVLTELQRQYGDFVRTGAYHRSPFVMISDSSILGPSEITVYHPDVFMAMDGPQGNCVKSEWYDVLHPKQSLVTARVKEVHGARRRQWNRGFTSQGRNSPSPTYATEKC